MARLIDEANSAKLGRTLTLEDHEAVIETLEIELSDARWEDAQLRRSLDDLLDELRDQQDDYELPSVEDLID